MIYLCRVPISHQSTLKGTLTNSQKAAFSLSALQLPVERGSGRIINLPSC
jgi:hypothetical protein